MKTKIFILSSIVSLCGAIPAIASDCTGSGCDIKPITFEEFEWIQETEQPNTIVVAVPQTEPAVVMQPTWMDSDPNVAEMPTAQEYVQPIVVQTQPKMQSVKLLSIKPVEEDGRPPLWDGLNTEYTGTTQDKTVDWHNGVPIWDESISNYKYKDFSDWYLEASPEIYLREVIETSDTSGVDPLALYLQNMDDAAATRARVEELLAPRKPSGNLWFENTQSESELTLTKQLDNTEQKNKENTVIETKETVVQTPQETVIAKKSVIFATDGCPFETQTECEIWRRKPIIRETVSPRSSKIRPANLNEFLHAADCNKDITANNPVAAPLLDRYKMLMRSARACCTDGMAYELKQAGASDALVYKFLSDDANFYGLGARCLMMTDHDLDTQYPNTATAVVAADVRNGCLCRSRQWFQAMLAPFQQVYDAMPEFKDTQFNYTYKDGLQREITVSINNDVQNVLKQLAQCP